MKTPNNRSLAGPQIPVAIFLVLNLLSACTPYDGPRAQGAEDRTGAGTRDVQQDVLQPPGSDKFTHLEGMLVYSGTEDALNKSSRLITIYGKDGAPWKVIDRDDDSLSSLTGEEGDFYPSFFSNGANRDFGIEMRAVARSEQWIEVVVHETRTPPLQKIRSRGRSIVQTAHLGGMGEGTFQYQVRPCFQPCAR